MTALVLAAARVVPLAWVGLPGVPRFVRAVVGLALALAVLPAAASPPVGAPLTLLLARELLAGIALGLCASVPLRAAEAAGGLLDEARAGGGDALRRGLLLLGLAVFASLGGPRLWIAALADSYAALPVGHAVAVGPVAIEATARLVGAAVELAAPALAALLAASVAVGLVARAAPSLGVAAATRGARDLAGLAALGAGAAAITAVLGGSLRSLGDELAAAARALAG